MSKVITDGTATFVVRDSRMQALVDMVYPVGSVYMSVSSTKPEFMNYGTWEALPSARCLETASDGHAGGTTIDAGLPNITGHYASPVAGNYQETLSGCFYDSKGAWNNYKGGAYPNYTPWDIAFSASRCSSIYGNSNTVQPNSYIVNAWRRTA